MHWLPVAMVQMVLDSMPAVEPVELQA
jgi:hypothetical protein